MMTVGCWRVDKDPHGLCGGHGRLAGSDARLEFYHGSFAQLPHQLRGMGIDAVDGILLDLGVSSPQLDDGERGFSFMHDGPLDMRMDTSCVVRPRPSGCPTHAER